MALFKKNNKSEPEKKKYARGQHPNSKKYRWKPGESGNPAGKPKGTKDKSLANIIEAIVQEEAEDGFSRLEKILRIMVAQAEEGSQGARGEMLDRLFGKARDTVDLNIGKGKEIDFSNLTDEELEDYERLTDKLIGKTIKD